jgi:hypothetical protein
MKIYVGHSREFDFKKELYEPLKQLNHNFIFPHEDSDEPQNSKESTKTYDLMIAEVSFPSTGLGIEIGWADALNISIIYIYQAGANISGSLKVMKGKFIEYSNQEDLIEKLRKEIN